MNQLIAYVIDGHELHIRPAPLERQWMDDSDQRFAYRCLPLNIANAHGWEILCTAAFSAIWDGQRAKDAIRIKTKSGAAAPVVSHFGGGILTFHIPCLFRTDPGVDLFVTGPINRPKDAIAALSGVVETDWSPYTFTMNWQVLHQHRVVEFYKNDPVCMLLPFPKQFLELFRPVECPLHANPAVQPGSDVLNHCGTMVLALPPTAVVPS